MPTTPLPDNLRRLIEAELAAGESLRLVVQPIPARRARALALGVLFFMALWTAGVSCLVGLATPAGGHFDFGPLEGVRAVLRLDPEARVTRSYGKAGRTAALWLREPGRYRSQIP